MCVQMQGKLTPLCNQHGPYGVLHIHGLTYLIYMHGKGRGQVLFCLVLVGIRPVSSCWTALHFLSIESCPAKIVIFSMTYILLLLIGHLTSLL